jgi:hypothetical protein
MWQTDQVRCLPLAGQLARWSPDGQKILFQQQLQFGGSRPRRLRPRLAEQRIRPHHPGLRLPAGTGTPGRPGLVDVL